MLRRRLWKGSRCRRSHRRCKKCGDQQARQIDSFSKPDDLMPDYHFL